MGVALSSTAMAERHSARSCLKLHWEDLQHGTVAIKDLLALVAREIRSTGEMHEQGLALSISSPVLRSNKAPPGPVVDRVPGQGRGWPVVELEIEEYAEEAVIHCNAPPLAPLSTRLSQQVCS
jgi:hypothetical protein